MNKGQTPPVLSALLHLAVVLGMDDLAALHALRIAYHIQARRGALAAGGPWPFMFLRPSASAPASPASSSASSASGSRSLKMPARNLTAYSDFGRDRRVALKSAQPVKDVEEEKDVEKRNKTREIRTPRP